MQTKPALVYGCSTVIHLVMCRLSFMSEWVCTLKATVLPRCINLLKQVMFQAQWYSLGLVFTLLVLVVYHLFQIGMCMFLLCSCTQNYDWASARGDWPEGDYGSNGMEMQTYWSSKWTVEEKCHSGRDVTIIVNAKVKVQSRLCCVVLCQQHYFWCYSLHII